MSEFFHVVSNALPSLLDGLRITLDVTASSLVLGLPLALALAVLVTSPYRVVRTVALVAVEVGRGIPLLLLLQLLYFGLPQDGLTLSSFVCATLALAAQAGSYGSEVFRASLAAVPVGQRESAMACGMSQKDSFLAVILPQAIRIAVPPLLSIGIAIFLASSLAYAIALPELMSHAYLYGTTTFQYLDVFIAAALMYAAIAIPGSIAVGRLERRLARHL